MKMFARFDENPAMTLQDIKKTKCYGQTDGRTHTRTDNVKTVYPPQIKFAGVIIFVLHIWRCLQGLMKIQQWLFKILKKQNVTDGRTHTLTDARTTWKQYTHHKQRGYKKEKQDKLCYAYHSWLRPLHQDSQNGRHTTTHAGYRSSYPGILSPLKSDILKKRKTLVSSLHAG